MGTVYTLQCYSTNVCFILHRWWRRVTMSLAAQCRLKPSMCTRFADTEVASSTPWQPWSEGAPPKRPSSYSPNSTSPSTTYSFSTLWHRRQSHSKYKTFITKIRKLYYPNADTKSNRFHPGILTIHPLQSTFFNFRSTTIWEGSGLRPFHIDALKSLMLFKD